MNLNSTVNTVAPLGKIPRFTFLYSIKYELRSLPGVSEVYLHNL